MEYNRKKLKATNYEFVVQPLDELQTSLFSYKDMENKEDLERKKRETVRLDN